MSNFYKQVWKNSRNTSMEKLNANLDGLVIGVSAKRITLSFIESKHTVSNTPFKCRKCEINFENSKQLWNHTKLKHENPSIVITCGKCSFECYRKQELKKHVQSDHENLNAISEPRTNVNNLEKEKIISAAKKIDKKLAQPKPNKNKVKVKKVLKKKNELNNKVIVGEVLETPKETEESNLDSSLSASSFSSTSEESSSTSESGAEDSGGMS